MVFKKKTIRVNPRVKFSLYSPTNKNKRSNYTSLLNRFSIDKPGILTKRNHENNDFEEKKGNRYASVDQVRIRNHQNAQTINASGLNLIQKSRSQGREWIKKEGPVEALKRQLKNYKK